MAPAPRPGDLAFASVEKVVSATACPQGRRTARHLCGASPCSRLLAVGWPRGLKLCALRPGLAEQSAELFTLTYGAIRLTCVQRRTCRGYNMGIRLVDEFLAKANMPRCPDFHETAEVIAKVESWLVLAGVYACCVINLLRDLMHWPCHLPNPQVGFKMFLGVSPQVANWNAEGTECSLILDDNPLVDFVELPETCQGLIYCNILCGVLRGALEMVSMRTEAKFVRDVLRGDEASEIRLTLLEQVPEEYPYKDDE
eukprot:SM000011S19128  [mRNA]  locus=s11:990576:991869:- [translate_table: standard]